MDNFLFYMYLEYLKENKLTFWPKLWKQPKVTIVLFILVTVFGILATVLSLFNVTERFLLISIIVEILCCMLLYFYTEHYKITCSKKLTDEYKVYCHNINKWLIDCNIKDEDAVRILYNRITKSIDEIKILDKEEQERTEKWLQALIIPVLLAIITTVISNSSNMELIIESTMTIIFVFIAIYLIFTTVKKTTSFSKKRRQEQLSCFANDLQGVLDTQFPNSVFK